MKIFLTEITVENKPHSGPNIIASSWEEAELVALEEGITVVGVLDSYFVPSSTTLH
tara:strand:- start:33 stop:200 length:168 start_codon:yes stop_codon:yes gene_type:complete